MLLTPLPALPALYSIPKARCDCIALQVVV
jgi:hypothetical protein